MNLTPELLRELLEYNSDTGVLIWKVRGRAFFEKDRHWKSWNARYAGKPALTAIDSKGYRNGSILNKRYRAHRVAFCLMMGEWPNIIDHINGDRLDNKWGNLRSTTQSGNLQNSRRPLDNTSGQVGVDWRSDRRKWRARICVNKDQISLGYFDTFEAACEMRKVAERNYLYHENHGRAA